MATYVTTSEYTAKLKAKGLKVKPLEPYTHGASAIRHACLDCGSTFVKAPYRVLAGYSCNACGKERSRAARTVSLDGFLKRLKSKPFANSVYLIDKKSYKNLNTSARFACRTCQHKWDARPASLLVTSFGCPKCANDLKGRRPDVVTVGSVQQRMDSRFGPHVIRVSSVAGGADNVAFSCQECGHSFNKSISDMEKSPRGCPRCSMKKAGIARRTTEKEYRTRLKKSTRGKVKLVGEYKGAENPTEHECSVCSTVWKTRPAVLLFSNISNNNCPTCPSKTMKMWSFAGKQFRYQGYEDRAIMWLIQNELVNVRDLFMNRGSDGLVAGTSFKYGEKARFYPDLIDAKTGMFYEVKSLSTLGVSKSGSTLFGTDPVEFFAKNMAKAKATTGKVTWLVTKPTGEVSALPQDWFRRFPTPARMGRYLSNQSVWSLPASHGLVAKAIPITEREREPAAEGYTSLGASRILPAGLSLDKTVKSAEANAFLAQHHYLGKRSGAKFVFALRRDGRVAGVALFSAATTSMRKFATKSNGSVLDLSRLCLEPDLNGTNAVSWFLRQALASLPESYIVLSYADTHFGHSGGVYKAAGFSQAGFSDDGRGKDVRIFIDGKETRNGWEKARKMILEGKSERVARVRTTRKARFWTVAGGSKRDRRELATKVSDSLTNYLA